MAAAPRMSRNPRTPSPCSPRGRRRSVLLSLVASAATLLLMQAHVSALAQAAQQASQAEPVFDIDLPAQALAQALPELSRRTGTQVFASGDLVRGRAAPAVRGRLSAQQAVNRLLAGSGLVAAVEGAAIVIKVAPAAAATTLPAIVVSASASADRETATGSVEGYVARRSATATKTDTLTREVPQSISVVTRDSLDARGVSNLSEALEYAPGFTSQAFGRDDRYDWSIARGIGDTYNSNFRDGLKERGSV